MQSPQRWGRPTWRSTRRFTLALLLLGVALLGPAVPATTAVAGDRTPLALWVQLGPDGSASARVVTSTPTCPAITVAGRSQLMAVRAHPAPPAFPVLVCETALSAGTRSAVVAGQRLPLPPDDPQRIVVVGDTGCLLKAGTAAQACHDPAAWPYAAIAARAAAWQPDLVIHAGDHVYRQAPCPAEDTGCAGSPWGDTWASWQADFFTPAAPLLRVAPWVVTRGNHDACGETGAVGWFRFLDPRPLPAGCLPYTEPYAVAFGDLQLLVMDNALAEDETVDTDQVAVYARQFAIVRALAGANAWLLGHRPLWALQNDSPTPGTERLGVLNQTLQAASGNTLPPGVQLVLTGHMHLLELLGFAGERPPQLVVGNSGVALDPPVSSALVGHELAGLPVATAVVVNQWGFLTMAASDGGWLAVVRDVAGDPVVTCMLRARRLSCPP